ncbi:PTS glucitol/sorbitol transporter subunit IIA [Acidipropionibacterium timonense]|uniref:PTS glucitol/sorbitol transporter subunit IIA n=1 Tax=Acidipropionibacterium timonense TaxID=2161818 RepID=UPI00103158C2|nr:PTS glucitol/sorbitol transporter subunit IIA [Acidipropionibacterium timonense]
MAIIYTSSVTAIGPEAASFLAEKMLVTFGANAPAELRDYCYILDSATSSGPIQPGSTAIIDGTAMTVTAIGSVAQKNLDALGHVTLVFDGADVPRMDGAIHLLATGTALPALQEGSTFTIENP